MWTKEELLTKCTGPGAGAVELVAAIKHQFKICLKHGKRVLEQGDKSRLETKINELKPTGSKVGEWKMAMEELLTQNALHSTLSKIRDACTEAAAAAAATNGNDGDVSAQPASTDDASSMAKSATRGREGVGKEGAATSASQEVARKVRGGAQEQEGQEGQGSYPWVRERERERG